MGSDWIVLFFVVGGIAILGTLVIAGVLAAYIVFDLMPVFVESLGEWFTAMFRHIFKAHQAPKGG